MIVLFGLAMATETPVCWGMIGAWANVPYNDDIWVLPPSQVAVTPEFEIVEIK